MVKKTCQSCTKEFEVKKYRETVAKFCSFPCYWSSLEGMKKGPLTAETKKKLSLAKTGKKRSGTVWNKGLKLPHLSGEKHSRWVKDRSKLAIYGDSIKDRRSSAYVTWRKDVCTRDEFTCRMVGGDCSGRLEVHHILSYSTHPELRYDIRNGITLCHFHHPRKRKDEQRLSPYFQELVNGKNYEYIRN